MEARPVRASVSLSRIRHYERSRPFEWSELSGSTYLDASASNATTVEFVLFGGSYGLSGHVVGTATPTLYGWLDSWNTTTVPNGSYVLVSYASGPGGARPVRASVSPSVTEDRRPFTSPGPARRRR